MNASTRRFALRAAAKVALSASFAACGGMVGEPGTENPEPATTHGTIDAATTAEDGAGRSPDTGSARKDARAQAGDAVAEAEVTFPEAGTVGCTGANQNVNAASSSAVFSCCASYLPTQLSDAAFGFNPSSVAVRACCGTVVGHLDQGSDSSTFEANYARVSSVLEACCEDLSPVPEGRACTPWGPPVPPEMPAS